MDLSLLQSPPRRQRVMQKLVASREDAKAFSDIFEMLKDQNRSIEVILFDNLEDVGKDWNDFTFFCGDFQSELYHKLTQNQEVGNHAHLIVGPAVLRHRLQTNQEMMTLRSCRPLYCELMKNVTMKLSSEVQNKKELVELVHFMGGSVRKDTVQRTNVMIAARAFGKALSVSCVLGIPTLRAEWILECWKFRDNPHYDVFDEKLITRFRLSVFEGLSLYFHGFKKQETEDMINNLEESGGLLAENVKKASHVVYNAANDGTENLEELPEIKGQFHVTQEWFWVSLHRGSCAMEDNFALPTRGLRKKHHANESLNSPLGKTPTRSANSKSASSMRDCSGEGPSLNATPDYIYSNDEMEKACKSPKPASRRLRICMEMVETETNYVNLLKLVIKFKTSLEHEITNNEFMTKSDVAMMFGKLEPIMEVHQKILDKLQLVLNEITALTVASTVAAKKAEEKFDYSQFSQVWIEMKEEMKRVYPPYLNSYDTAKNLFDTLDKENSKFHTFCKAKESNPDFHRLKLNDLMVKPVQRLPSVILLLKEMTKKAEAPKFKTNAEEATKAVDEVLKIANKTRERNDNLISHMSKFTDIENVPPHLVAANRMFIRDVVVSPIASSCARFVQFNRMKLFFFHDVMLITKVRSEKNTMQRLARHASFASLHTRTRRPYKYIEQIPLVMIRNAVRIRPDDECMKEAEIVFGKNNIPYLWCLIHRYDHGGDAETLLEALDSEEMKEFLDDIHIKILSNYGRMFLINDFETPSRLTEKVAEMAQRYFRRLIYGQAATNYHHQTVSERTPGNGNEWSHNLNESMFAPPQSQSKMRRAFSNAQLTLATTFGFGRHQSRNNLAQINENSMIQSPRVSCDPAALANMTCVVGQPEGGESTPKRGLRARLTSSTFLNRTLNRNASMRRQSNVLQPLDRNNRHSKTSTNCVTDF